MWSFPGRCIFFLNLEHFPRANPPKVSGSICQVFVQKRVVFPTMTNTSWWFFTNPFEKYYIVELDHFSRDRGEKKYLKPPPSQYSSPSYTLVSLPKNSPPVTQLHPSNQVVFCFKKRTRAKRRMFFVEKPHFQGCPDFIETPTVGGVTFSRHGGFSPTHSWKKWVKLDHEPPRIGV